MKKFILFTLVLTLAGFVRAEIIDGIPVDNLIAWYDANDIDIATYVGENNVITTWPNKVAGGIDLEKYSGTMYYEASNPIFNNAACIDQITGTGVMTAPGLVDMLDGKTFSIFTVVDSTGGTGPGFTNEGGGGRLYGRGHQFYVGDPAISAIPPTLVTTPSIRVYQLDADYDEGTDTYSNGSIRMQINNDPNNVATNSTESQGSVITFGNGYFKIPYTAGTGNYGKYAEIMIFDRALNKFEENAVGYYLAQKYNIADSFFTDPGPLRTLTISADPSFVDTIDPAAGTYQFYNGQEVALTADLYPDCPDIYELNYWTGDVNDLYSAQTTITMDGDKTVVANYTISSIECVTLMIETSPPGLAATTPAGYYSAAPGEIVPIGALVDYVDCPQVYAFANWTGDGIDNPLSASTTVEVTANQTVTAVYNDNRICGDQCHPYPDADFNQDCVVNLLDFAIAAQYWLECTDPACD